MIHRLPVLASAALGCMLLASCDPFGPPPGPSPYGPQPAAPYPPQGPVRGDGYAGGSSYDTPNPYGPRQTDPYGQSDGGGYEEVPAPRTNTPPANPGNQRTEYPVAERTAKPNEVISPFPPYNVIDVSEMKSGQLARDPSNKKIFRVP